MDNFNNNNPNHPNYEYEPSGQGYYNAGYYGEGGPQSMYEGGGEQAYYQEGGAGVYAPGYGAEATDPSYQNQQYGYSQGAAWNQQPQGSNDWGPEVAAKPTKPGSYYLHNEFAPQIFGFPVSALAFDPAYEAMYIASTTQSVSSTRWRSNRASMLATHSTLDGSLYSSVAGHPEAASSTLQAVYECMYGIPKTVPMPPGRHHIPPHAYRPPFGSSEVETSMSSIMGGKHGHIGITSMLPLGGYAASVSPAAVRLHAHGGLQVHDHEIKGMLSGTIHPHSDQGGATHISVGGIPCGGTKFKENEIHCMDLWQGLRVVSSRSFKDRYTKKVAVTTMATSHDRGSIVAGCSDGYIRVLDGSLRELATIKSHKGGVSSLAISPDGNLIATTGYSSRAVKGKETSVLYALPDPTVLVYDIRYLGRGGISHPFAGVRGSPHHVAFVPDIENLASNRLVVGSGQSGGGLQIIVPFEAQNEKSTSFFLPQLEQSESISAMTQSEDDLALGTSAGRVLRYKLTGYSTTKHKTPSSNSGAFVPSGSNSPSRSSSSNGSRPAKKEKRPLETPPFVPPMPAVSMDPKLLQPCADPGMRNGADEKIKSLFAAYILQADPKLSTIGNSVEEAMSSFGSLAGNTIVPNSRRTVAANFIKEAAPAEGDCILTIPTSKLELDLLSDHNPVSKRYRGKKVKETRPNPNKLLYNSKLSSICYEGVMKGRRKLKGQKSSGSSSDLNEEMPPRYRLQLRPKFKSAGAFDPADHNDSGLFPGWDYSPAMPNAFAPPVLLLFYFIPEMRSAVLAAQYNEKLFSARGYEKALAPELGFIFHHIESLSRFGLLHPVKPSADPLQPRIGVWAPSNFLTALGTMPEAEQLQILDGSPAAVDPPRRPEAFYRFLAYQLDKELSKNSGTKRMDSLQGLDFISLNQFITGSSPPSQSTTRALTVDLNYDLFSREAEKKSVRFGELLRHSLCRETRLRAWNQSSRAYETIVQRKIATSLPQILTLSCACAGRKQEDGLWVWRTDDGEPWLPEVVDIELLEDGNVLVRELVKCNDEGKETWSTFKGKSSLPPTVSKLVSEVSSKQKYRYRLDAVLSFVSDDVEVVGDDEHPGHHVLHARVPHQYKKRVLRSQQEEAGKLALREPDASKLVMTASVKSEVFRKRSEHAGKRLSAANEEGKSGWVLYNGFAVSNTVVEDARAFHVPFKEPCLVVFRALEGDPKGKSEETEKKNDRPSPRIPAQVMNARSLSSTSSRTSRSFNPDTIEDGKLIAFDAEFVSVQDEEATLNESGLKMILRETRHAVGRISVIDCSTRQIILDDHVLPRERVVDYLTRFSGIVAEDLDPSKTPHSLISTRSGYLKLRFLMEQGCIFVGHGLRQDFATVNLIVPPNQILDTVEIFHQPGMRYISLRFLANCVLGRDMQQDVHDSVEDALAAFELYEKALEWKQEGVFDKKVQEIYTHGKKTDWKLGLE